MVKGELFAVDEWEPIESISLTGFEFSSPSKSFKNLYVKYSEIILYLKNNQKLRRL